MSATDPKSAKQLRDLQDKRNAGQTISKNDKWELDQARKYGVKGVFD